MKIMLPFIFPIRFYLLHFLLTIFFKNHRSIALYLFYKNSLSFFLLENNEYWPNKIKILDLTFTIRKVSKIKKKIQNYQYPKKNI